MKNFIKISVCFIALSLGLLPFKLMAQAQLGEIEINSEAEHFVSKSSRFSTILKPNDYDIHTKSLAELLSEQANVQISQFGGLGHLSTISIRGSSAEQVAVLVDGIKINTAQGGSVDFSSIPLDQIENIEIIKGGSSALYGSDAMGGAVLIKTKRAGYKRKSYEFSLGGGSYNTLKIQNAFSARNSKLAFSISQSHLQSDGDFKFKPQSTQIASSNLSNQNVFVRENNGFFTENGLLKLEYFPNENWDVGISSDWMGSRREVPPTEQEYILLSPQNPPEARELLLKNTSSIIIKRRNLFLEGAELEIQPSYHWDKSHFTDPSPGLGSAIDTLYNNQSSTIKFEYKYSLQTKKMRHNLFVKYEPKADFFRSENKISNNTESHKRFVNAVSMGDEVLLFNEKLKFQPIVRFEDSSDFASKFMGHAGLVYKPWPNVSLKGNFDQSFRYPNFNELYFPNQGIIRGNPSLIPEYSKGFDLGFEVKHAWGSHEISYFKNWIDNSIIFVPISAFTIAPQNSRAVNCQGLEVTTSLNYKKTIFLDGNYSFLQSHLQDSNKQLPGRAKHKANAKLSLKTEKFSLYGSIQYLDKLPLDFQNSSFINSRTQLDFGASVLLKKAISLNFEAKNVSNVKLMDARGFPLPGRSYFLSMGIKI